LSYCKGQLKDGLEQKKNIRFKKTKIGERLAVGLYAPQSGSKSRAHLVIKDPPDDDAIELDIPEEEISEFIARGELASSLQLCRLPTLANYVARGERERAQDDEAVQREIQQLQQLQTGFLGRREIVPFVWEQEGTRRSYRVVAEVGVDKETLAAARNPALSLVQFASNRQQEMRSHPAELRTRTQLGLHVNAQFEPSN
jgi:hypothetical protein